MCVFECVCGFKHAQAREKCAYLMHIHDVGHAESSMRGFVMIADFGRHIDSCENISSSVRVSDCAFERMNLHRAACAGVHMCWCLCAHA